MPIFDSAIKQDVILCEFLNNPKKEKVGLLKSSYKVQEKFYTPIEICAFYGLLDPLKILLQYDSFYRKGSNLYLDAFFQAAMNGKEEIIYYLFDEYFLDKKNQSHLIQVINFLFNKNLTLIIKYLLGIYSIELFLENFSEMLLIWSCKNNLQNYFEHFITLPEVVENAGENNSQALLYAIEVQNDYMIRWLLSQESVVVNLLDISGFAVLYKLLNTNNFICFKDIVEKYKSSFQKKLADKNNELLKVAIQQNDINAFEYLMSFEKTKRLFNKEPFTYLYHAVLSNRPEMAGYILAQAGVAEIAHDNKNIILSECLKLNMVELSLQLLDLPKVKKNIFVNDFMILSVAIKSNNIEFLSKLIQKQGVLKYLYRLDQANNPINLSVEHLNLEIFNLFIQDQTLLKNAFLGPNNPLVIAAEVGCVEITHKILTENILKDIGIFEIDDHLKSRIFSAAMNNNKENMIGYLLTWSIFSDFFIKDYASWFTRAVNNRLRNVLFSFESIIMHKVLPYTFNIETLEGQVGQLIFRAPFKETAMQDLKNEEILGLTDLLMHYHDVIYAKDLDAHLEDLSQVLANDYRANPIKIQIGDGRMVELPLEWQDFQLLLLTEKFSFETTQKLFISYHYHTTHTAWRYLQKPNPWISPEAEVVLEDEDGQGRYADFEMNKELLVCLWLASKDENFKPLTDTQMTVSDRQQIFFEGLAGLNRSNNLFMHGQDSDGDKPSCPAGVKNLLIHSLVAHPLMVVLTESYVKTEFYSYLNVFWKECLMYLTPFNILKLANLWENIVIKQSETVDGLDKLQFNQLIDFFNITENDKNRFFQEMQQTFGHKWDAAIKLHIFAENLFIFDAVVYNSLPEKFGMYFDSFIKAEAFKIQQLNENRRQYSGTLFSESPTNKGSKLVGMPVSPSHHSIDKRL